MDEITCFGLESHPGPYQSWPLSSRLLLDGRPTATALTGYIIEKQFRSAAGVVLATSCDCPYEERRTFYLLDEQLGVVDDVTCFTPYDTWLLDRMEPLDEHSFRVVFYSEFACVLRILPRDAGGWLLELGRDE